MRSLRLFLPAAALACLALPLLAESDREKAERIYRTYYTRRGDKSQDALLTRTNMLRSLGSLRGDGVHELRMKAMRGARWPCERLLAVTFAGPIRDRDHLAETLRHVLKKREPGVVRAFGDVLGGTASAEVKTWVVERGLRASDPATVEASCHALERLAPAEARPALLALYEAWAAQRTRGELVHAVVRALGALDGPEVERVLAAAAVHPDPRIRLAASDVLARRPELEDDPETVGRLLRDTDFVVRRATAQSIGQAGREDHVPGLLDMMQADPLKGCRAAAYEALRRVTGQDFGFDPPAWRAWWRKKTQPDPRRKRVTVARYYGYSVVSDNVWFLVDVSGSMRHPTRRRPRRIDVARDELVEVLRALAPTTRMNVVAYADRAKVWSKRAVPAEPKAVENAVEWVYTRFAPEGQTALDEALALAFEDPGVDTIFVLSDGLPNIGDYLSRESVATVTAARNRFRRVTIHTIVLTLAATVGPSEARSAVQAEWLMRRLAAASGGRCEVVARPPAR